MKRRDFLKWIAVAGVGSAVGSWWWPFRESQTLVLITDQPRRDLAQLSPLLEAGSDPWEVEYYPVDALPQDVTLIRNGVLMDPVKGVAVPGLVTRLAREMRQRHRPGYTLILARPAVRTREEGVEIRVDGVLFARLDGTRNYDRIDVPGPMGKTVLRYRDGKMQVIQSSCRHRLCEQMGPMAQGKLICAPNRLLVTLAPTSLDAVVG
ncbi:MAG: hypothetical protein GXO78_04840 [Calditrichaeota bacterium]|nr:hypothetical protein [Calditrichota bacterium]